MVLTVVDKKGRGARNMKSISFSWPILQEQEAYCLDPFDPLLRSYLVLMRIYEMIFNHSRTVLHSPHPSTKAGVALINDPKVQ